MKTYLISFLISFFVHGSLAWFAYSLATEPLPKPDTEKVIPLQLSMFQQPEAKPQPTPTKITPPAPAITQPKPVQVTPIPPKPVQPKPVAAKPEVTKPIKPITAKPEVAKPTPKKIVKAKKKPEKIPKKEKKLKQKPKPVEKKIAKKPAKKPKKVTKPKVRDKALDDMIRAYQATQKTPTTTQPTPVAAARPRPRATQSTRPTPPAPPKKIITKQVTTTKPTTTPIVAKKTALKRPPNNGQAEQRYKARLQRLIAQQKTYPKRARRRAQEGTVIVSFTLYPNGNISQIRIKKSSGSNSLDKAALQTIQRVSGALAFPAEIRRKQWSFSLPLIYRLH